jgi:hypothetical protein
METQAMLRERQHALTKLSLKRKAKTGRMD